MHHLVRFLRVLWHKRSSHKRSLHSRKAWTLVIAVTDAHPILPILTYAEPRQPADPGRVQGRLEAGPQDRAGPVSVFCLNGRFLFSLALPLGLRTKKTTTTASSSSRSSSNTNLPSESRLAPCSSFYPYTVSVPQTFLTSFFRLASSFLCVVPRGGFPFANGKRRATECRQLQPDGRNTDGAVRRR